MLIYTIMPDYGQAYGWRKPPDSPPWAGVGENVAGFGGWGGDPPISSDLENAFKTWQGEFESHAWHGSADKDCYADFDWASFHARGLDLTIRLKAELGDAAVVIYEKPFEDPNRNDHERTEIRAGGQPRLLPSRKEIAARYP